MNSIFAPRIKPFSLPYRSRFTVVELLVLIAVILVLSALFLSCLRNVVGHVYVNSCANNLRQVGLSLSAYGDDFFGKYPLGYGTHAIASKLYATGTDARIHAEFWYYAENYALTPRMVSTNNWLPEEHGIFVCPGKPGIPTNRTTDGNDISYVCGQIFPNYYLLGTGRSGRSAIGSFVVSARVSADAQKVYGTIASEPPYRFVYPHRTTSPAVWPVFFDEALPYSYTNAAGTRSWRNNHGLNEIPSINTLYLDNSVRKQMADINWTGDFRGRSLYANPGTYTLPQWYLPYPQCSPFTPN